MKLFIFLSLIFISCKSTETRKSCEGNLKLGLSKNWRYDSNLDGYISNERFLTNIDSVYKDCLHRKDTTDIRKLFGEHYSITPSRNGINDFIMEFHLINFSPERSGIFYFELDKKYKVVVNYYIGIEGSPPIH